MSEAELARNLHDVLEKVRQGIEVVIEQDARPVAVITTPQGGRSIDESIALAEAYEQELGFSPLPDAEFAKDLQSAVDSHPEPLTPPLWD